MESSGSSFIPQRPTKGRVAAKSFRKVYVLSYVSYLIFFTTLLAVGGIYVYQLTLKSELSSYQQQLVDQKNLFSQSDLDRVRNLDYRIDTAVQLVNNHASLLKVFNALDEVTANPIQFLSFDYSRKEDLRKPSLTLSAVASGFDEVIFQNQILRSNAITKYFDITNVSLTTQPINPDNPELGTHQVVNASFLADLSVSDINFTGFAPGSGNRGALLNSDQPQTNDEAEVGGVDDAPVNTDDSATEGGTGVEADGDETSGAAVEGELPAGSDSADQS